MYFILQVDLVIRGLFICEFAYSHFKNWFKMPNFQSKCVFLSVNSVFGVQNSRTYLPRITKPTCKDISIIYCLDKPCTTHSPFEWLCLLILDNLDVLNNIKMFSNCNLHFSIENYKGVNVKYINVH